MNKSANSAEEYYIERPSWFFTYGIPAIAISVTITVIIGIFITTTSFNGIALYKAPNINTNSALLHSNNTTSTSYASSMLIYETSANKATNVFVERQVASVHRPHAFIDPEMDTPTVFESVQVVEHKSLLDELAPRLFLSNARMY